MLVFGVLLGMHVRCANLALLCMCLYMFCNWLCGAGFKCTAQPEPAGRFGACPGCAVSSGLFKPRCCGACFGRAASYASYMC